MSRIAGVFDKLRAKNRAAFIPFIMAGDPDADISLEILKGLPSAGADIIELGVAFTDPMADGPSVQAAGLRALQAGQTLSKTLDLVRAFRRENDTTLHREHVRHSRTHACIPATSRQSAPAFVCVMFMSGQRKEPRPREL